MTTSKIRFNDGAAYERYMGKWSQLAGEVFLDWIAPEPGQQWLDVGCGNGAFTEMLVERCDPAAVHGLDPSEEQLAYARARPVLRTAQFTQGNAMALPYPDNMFDVAIMPLVICFVPDPALGVAEMKRVVCPGGTIATYIWDLLDGGFPYEVLLAEIRGLGISMPTPPSPEASKINVMRDLWADAGLDAIETREITVHRTFDNFDSFWTTALGAPSAGATLSRMPPEDITLLKTRVCAQLPADATGQITYSARANAVKGRVAK